jgi:hypothetical protein
MQRLLDIAQLCFYLTAIAVMLWVGTTITTRLARLDRELDQNAILYDQMLKEHLQHLENYERRMQRSEVSMPQPPGLGCPCRHDARPTRAGDLVAGA